MQSGQAQTLNGFQIVPLGACILRRSVYAVLTLATLSAAIGLGGRWLGGDIAAGGHTESTRRFEIVIGNDVLAVPANAIRSADQRRDGVTRRLDLYLHWPELSGYTDAARDAFNNAGGKREIVFVSLEPRTMSQDMSGRFAPIYRNLIEPDGRSGPAGLEIHRFTAESGFADEVLAVADGHDATPFVARCLSGPAAAQSLAPCERDIALGEGLSLTYRFPDDLLADWKRLDAAIAAKAKSYLQTAE